MTTLITLGVNCYPEQPADPECFLNGDEITDPKFGEDYIQSTLCCVSTAPCVEQFEDAVETGAIQVKYEFVFNFSICQFFEQEDYGQCSLNLNSSNAQCLMNRDCDGGTCELKDGEDCYSAFDDSVERCTICVPTE